MPCNLIYHTLWRRSNSQNCQTSRVNLRPASILNHLSGETHIESLPPEIHQLGFALDLHGNLGLAALLPAGKEFTLKAVGGCADEGLVAGEGGVGALGGDFACVKSAFFSFHYDGSSLVGASIEGTQSREMEKNVPLVIPKSVLTTKTSLHSSPESSSNGFRSFMPPTRALARSPCL